jgi:hypothetical protein
MVEAAACVWGRTDFQSDTGMWGLQGSITKSAASFCAFSVLTLYLQQGDSQGPEPSVWFGLRASLAQKRCGARLACIINTQAA